MELIFLDTETTGNEPGKDRLAELCYKTSGGEEFCGYFKPPISMSVKAMSITHITNKMLADKESFNGSETSKKLQTLLDGGVMVAHNAVFDKAMLEAEGISVPRFICTLRVARHLDTKNIIPEYNLQYLRYYLELDIVGGAHDARTDVNVLEAVFERLVQKIQEEFSDRDKVIERMIEISSTPTVFNIFNFGKYKDKRIEEVAMTDRPYLEWLLHQKLQNEKSDEDWIFTLRHFLKNV